MSYSDEELEEISHDRVRLKAWWWRTAMRLQRMAAEDRRASRATGVAHPVTNYRPIFEESRDLIRWASINETLAKEILDNIEALVESTYEPP